LPAPGLLSVSVAALPTVQSRLDQLLVQSELPGRA
jgi:hypothetical protein